MFSLKSVLHCVKHPTLKWQNWVRNKNRYRIWQNLSNYHIYYFHRYLKFFKVEKDIWKISETNYFEFYVPNTISLTAILYFTSTKSLNSTSSGKWKRKRSRPSRQETRTRKSTIQVGTLFVSSKENLIKSWQYHIGSRRVKLQLKGYRFSGGNCYLINESLEIPHKTKVWVNVSFTRDIVGFTTLPYFRKAWKTSKSLHKNEVVSFFLDLLRKLPKFAVQVFVIFSQALITWINSFHKK